MACFTQNGKLEENDTKISLIIRTWSLNGTTDENYLRVFAYFNKINQQNQQNNYCQA